MGKRSHSQPANISEPLPHTTLQELGYIREQQGLEIPDDTGEKDSTQIQMDAFGHHKMVKDGL